MLSCLLCVGVCVVLSFYIRSLCFYVFWVFCLHQTLSIESVCVLLHPIFSCCVSWWILFYRSLFDCLSGVCLSVLGFMYVSNLHLCRVNASSVYVGWFVWLLYVRVASPLHVFCPWSVCVSSSWWFCVGRFWSLQVCPRLCLADATIAAYVEHRSSVFALFCGLSCCLSMAMAMSIASMSWSGSCSVAVSDLVIVCGLSARLSSIVLVCRFVWLSQLASAGPLCV